MQSHARCPPPGNGVIGGINGGQKRGVPNDVMDTLKPGWQADYKFGLMLRSWYDSYIRILNQS